MIQEQAVEDVGATPKPDPWSGWAKVVDRFVAGEEVDVNDHEAEVGPEHADADVEVPAPAESPPEPARQPSPPPDDDLVSAVARLAAELADERRKRTAAEDGRRRAQERVHAAEVDATRVTTELTTARARVGELERDRDEVIRRAEELLTAVRERADLRLAAELDAAGRHWSELLAEERRRAEALDSERAALATHAEDAWLAAAVLRRARPLRLRDDEPATAADAEAEVLEALGEYETDPVFAAESPEIAGEIEDLRQRLRARVHKPADIDAVEDGVDQLREARLAREVRTKSRRRK